MSDLGFPRRKADASHAEGIADPKGAATAFACVVVSTVGLVLAPLVGQGSFISFAIGGAVFFAGIVGFVEILKRSSDWRD